MKWSIVVMISVLFLFLGLGLGVLTGCEGENEPQAMDNVQDNTTQESVNEPGYETLQFKELLSPDSLAYPGSVIDNDHYQSAHGDNDLEWHYTLSGFSESKFYEVMEWYEDKLGVHFEGGCDDQRFAGWPCRETQS